MKPSVRAVRGVMVVAALFGTACGGSTHKSEAPYGLTERVDNTTCVIETVDPNTGLISLPPTLSQTGCYSDLVNKVPAPGLTPFNVRVPLWSDGADKRRYFALPAGSTIGFAATGAWDFPVGTIFMKEFSLDLTSGDDTTRYVMETRFFVHGDSKWRGYSYRWSADDTDGTLLETSDTEAYTYTDTNGATQTHNHYFPTRSECLRCHPRDAGSVIGPQSIQMNRDFDYASGVTDNQIRAFNHIGLFDHDVSGEIAGLGALPDPEDTSQPLETRARALLHADCSHCHQPLGTATSALIRDMRFTTALADTAICPQVVPGNAASSVLWQQVSTISMPPIAVFTLDPRLDVVMQWITAMTSCP